MSDRNPHTTRPVQVWADIDVGIADLVEYLNTIPGVRTQYSCQGTLQDEVSFEPYRAHVGVTWDTQETFYRLIDEFDMSDISFTGNCAELYPRVKGDTYV